MQCNKAHTFDDELHYQQTTSKSMLTTNKTQKPPKTQETKRRIKGSIKSINLSSETTVT